MRILALSTILLALGACQSGSGLGDAFDTRQNAGTCPPAGSIYNASRIVQFDGVNRLLIGIAAAIYLLGVQLPTFTINVPLNNQLQMLQLDVISDRSVIADTRQYCSVKTESSGE